MEVMIRLGRQLRLFAVAIPLDKDLRTEVVLHIVAGVVVVLLGHLAVVLLDHLAVVLLGHLAEEMEAEPMMIAAYAVLKVMSP